MDDRNDRVISHALTRSKQPSFAKGAAGQPVAQGPTHVTNNYYFDSPWSSVSDQMDDMRFRYIGTSYAPTRAQTCGNRRLVQGCLGSVFEF